MKKCPDCHAQMNEGTNYCTLCGASLKNTQTNNLQSQKRPKKRGMTFFLGALIIVLIISLFTSYQLLSKKYSAEAVKEQFEAALIDQDRTSLKKIIQPEDSRMEINDDSLDALFALIESEKSIVYEMVDWRSDYDNDSRSFSLKQDGKHYGIFDRYVINTQGYYLILSNISDEKSTFYLNEKEITILEKEEDFKEIGPLLTGSYLVKATSDENGKKGEDMMNIKLSGTDSKLEVMLDTEMIDNEEEIEEAFNWPEQSNMSFILPDSDSVYLDTSDLIGLTSAELRVARNEIYARHGYVFESKDLQNYFSSLDWYYPDVNYNGSLSDIEKSNVDLVKSVE